MESDATAAILSGLGLDVVASASNEAIAEELRRVRAQLSDLAQGLTHARQVSTSLSSLATSHDVPIEHGVSMDGMLHLWVVLQEKLKALQMTQNTPLVSETATEDESLLAEVTDDHTYDSTDSGSCVGTAHHDVAPTLSPSAIVRKGSRKTKEALVSQFTVVEDSQCGRYGTDVAASSNEFQALLARPLIDFRNPITFCTAEAPDIAFNSSWGEIAPISLILSDQVANFEQPQLETGRDSHISATPSQSALALGQSRSEEHLQEVALPPKNAGSEILMRFVEDVNENVRRALPPAAPTLASLEMLAEQVGQLVEIVDNIPQKQAKTRITPQDMMVIDEKTRQIVLSTSLLLHEFRPASVDLVRVIAHVQEPLRWTSRLASLFPRCFFLVAKVRPILAAILPSDFVEAELTNHEAVKLVWLGVTFLVGVGPDKSRMNELARILDALSRYSMEAKESQSRTMTRLPLLFYVLSMLTRRLIAMGRKNELTSFKISVERLLPVISGGQEYLQGLITPMRNKIAELRKQRRSKFHKVPSFDFEAEFEIIRRAIPWFFSTLSL